MQIDLQIGGDNGRIVKSGELTPVANGPEGVSGYRVDATGDFVIPTGTGGFLFFNGQNGSWDEWTAPNQGEWARYNEDLNAWRYRPDVQAINAEGGRDKGRFAEMLPYLLPAAFGAGTMLMGGAAGAAGSASTGGGALSSASGSAGSGALAGGGGVAGGSGLTLGGGGGGLASMGGGTGLQLGSTGGLASMGGGTGMTVSPAVASSFGGTFGAASLPAFSLSNLASGASLANTAASAANGANTAGSLIPGIPNQLLGAGLGAAAGALGGNSDPAGTTTTTQDVPAYQLPYVQDLLRQAQSTFQANQGNQTPMNLANAGSQNMLGTIRGDFLDPSTNPWLKKTYDMAADSVGSGVDSRFTASGRYGSGAHQGVLGKTFGDLATNIYGGNYQQERGRQMTAALGAPEYASAYQQTPYGNLNNYANIAGRSFGSSTQQPYFNAPAGQSILGGALTGAMAGKMLGGFDFGSMFK